MAEADIAYVATAGAAGLALAISAWAWRLRGRTRVSQASAERALAELEAAVAARQSALAAFSDLRISLPPAHSVGEAYQPLAMGDPVIIDVMGGDAAGAARGILEAVRAQAGPRLEALCERGEPLDLMLEFAGAVWRVEGRAMTGDAWLRLTPLDTATAVGNPAGGQGLLAELSPIPTWVLDPGGRVAWANRAWLDAVGAEDLEDARARNLTFDRGADAIATEATRTGMRQEGFRWTAGEGRRNAWRIIAQPAPGASGAAVVFALDATEAEETRDALRRHVTAHDETLNHLADAVAIFGPSRRLAFHNTAFQQLFNIDPAWLEERPTHGELLDRLRQRRMLPEVIDYAGWKARELDFYGAAEASPDDSWSLPDGRTLRVVRQPHPLGGVLLIFSDITDELKLRSRFNAQIQVQTATLDKLNDAVAVFGSDGRLRLHNEAFETFWGLSSERLGDAVDFDAVAQMCKGVMPDPGLWLGLKARVADPDPESRIAVSGEGRTADGRIAVWQTRPLPDGATLVAFSDVTAQRELEQALVAKAAALEESQALKREFVGSVSYELRTPLTTIVGYSELLEMQPDLPDRSRQHAGAIRIAASQLARSIDDVLDMAQIDAGEMELSLGDLSLADLLGEAGDAVRARVEGRGAHLVVETPRSPPVVRGDAVRLRLALDHLLDNAARAVSEGGIVTLSLEGSASEARIRVTDTGRGIPYHLQAHVFDRFVRRERGGPGVGLALVKALVELHGGWAEVESEPGKGAAFILHLPLAVAGDAASGQRQA